MDCQFCHQPTTEIDSGDGEEKWICYAHKGCNVTFNIIHLYHKEGQCRRPQCCPMKELYSIELFNSNYHVYLYPNRPRFDVYSSIGNFIFSLSVWPEITPENMNDKLPIYTLFS